MPKTVAKTPTDGAKAVRAYLARLPGESRAALEKLRHDIITAAPKAEELLAWGMPAFRQGRLLVGYAAFKEHCSFFPMSVAVMKANAAALKEFVTTKGSVHFTGEKPMPSALVKRMVRARLAENETSRARRRPRRLD